jgi:hypothetical protein
MSFFVIHLPLSNFICPKSLQENSPISAIKSRQFLKNILEYELLIKMAGNGQGLLAGLELLLCPPGTAAE